MDHKSKEFHEYKRDYYNRYRMWSCAQIEQDAIDAIERKEKLIADASYKNLKEDKMH